MLKVFIIDGNPQYKSMFLNRGGWEIVDNLFDADLVQFTGGEDVSPELYGEANISSYNNIQRDLREAGVFAVCRRLNIPMAGICRGGQFLNVMCGGHMIQHVEGHAINGTHLVVDENTHVGIKVTSTHHQMMIPAYEGKVIAAGSIIKKDEDIEVVWYENNNCLCFQPHPEFPCYQECTDYYFYLIDKYLNL